MRLVSKNPGATVGIVTEVKGVSAGDFSIAAIEEWLAMIKVVLGSSDIHIEVKLADNPEIPAYILLASRDGEDPKIAVCGMARADGKPWGEK